MGVLNFSALSLAELLPTRTAVDSQERGDGSP
jgi:hypothetical protein